MDVQVLALIAMMISVVGITIWLDLWWWPGRPGYEYQRVFAAAAAGLLYFIGGLIGWDLKYSHGFFRGTKWVDPPVWWQVGLGAALLLLAGYWATRVPPHPTPRSRD